jgi:hypothetical protein
LGAGDQLRSVEPKKLDMKVLATAVVANLASHMVLVAFVVLLSRIARR